MTHIVGTDWLSKNLADIRILDGTWYLPNMQKDGRTEYQHAHIPNAQFFDIDEISDQNSTLPHMVPNNAQFAAAVGAMGIRNDDTVVIYDQLGLFSAARVWWLFKLMGHDAVYVLDGGLPKWQAEGHATSNHPTLPAQPSTYHATMRPDWIATAQQVQNSTAQILDARPAARFYGQAPEPRPNTRSGHIPGSVNLPYDHLLNADGTLKSKDALQNLAAQMKINLHDPIITTCGSGVTAALMWLALDILGADNLRLYDGSWAQWGTCYDLPIATGV